MRNLSCAILLVVIFSPSNKTVLAEESISQIELAHRNAECADYYEEWDKEYYVGNLTGKVGKVVACAVVAFHKKVQLKLPLAVQNFIFKSCVKLSGPKLVAACHQAADILEASCMLYGPDHWSLEKSLFPLRRFPPYREPPKPHSTDERKDHVAVTKP
jgi:hypothetical protein